jgi:hypothetical protein
VGWETEMVLVLLVLGVVLGVVVDGMLPVVGVGVKVGVGVGAVLVGLDPLLVGAWVLDGVVQGEGEVSEPCPPLRERLVRVLRPAWMLASTWCLKRIKGFGLRLFLDWPSSSAILMFFSRKIGCPVCACCVLVSSVENCAKAQCDTVGAQTRRTREALPRRLAMTPRMGLDGEIVSPLQTPWHVRKPLGRPRSGAPL